MTLDLSNRNYEIVVFGDSIPKGIVNEDNKLKKIENNVVDLISKEINLKIQNNSIYGQTLSRLCEKKIIENYIENVDKSKKNLVIISLGGNDADFDWKQVELSPNENHIPKTSIKDFEHQLDYVVKLLRKNGIHVVLTTIPPINSKRYFDNVISKIADGQKIMQFFKNDISNIQRQQEFYNYEIINCAMKNNCQVIDIRTEFLIQKDYLSYICADGIHPNEKGHSLMANSILSKLKNGEIKLM